MSDDEKIVKFEPRKVDPGSSPRDRMVGPERIKGHHVIVGGRIIPNVICTPTDDGMVEFILDERFSYEFPAEWAYLAAAFAAQAMAIGAGYSHIEAPNKDKPFAPQIAELGEQQ